MTRSTDDLIGELSGGLTPVRRLAPPMRRALTWLAGLALASGLAVVVFADRGALSHRLSSPRLDLEIAATFMTGAVAVVAAFHLALPDRPRAWAWAPLPFAVLWLALSGAGCWTSWVETGGQGMRLGQSVFCLEFIVGLSLPIGAALLWALARARPLDPGPVAAVGGLGAAALCAVLLQAFHPHAANLVDLAYHVVAVVVVILAARAIGRRAMG